LTKLFVILFKHYWIEL